MASKSNKKKCNIKKKWVDAEFEEHKHLFKKKVQRKMTRKITKDHVNELGCDYYPELFKMERKLRRKNE